VTLLEVVGAVAAPLALTLAAATIYLSIRLQRTGDAMSGQLVLAGTRQLEAERRAGAAETALALSRGEATALRAAVTRVNDELATSRGSHAFLRDQLAAAMKELDACADATRVRERLRGMLSGQA
jgi:hypothetical protein